MKLSEREIIQGLESIRKTGKDSRVEVTLKDGTVFTAHPVRLDDEEYDEVGYAFTFSQVKRYPYPGVVLRDIQSFRQIASMSESVTVSAVSQIFTNN
jgi:hypothetical protein